MTINNIGIVSNGEIVMNTNKSFKEFISNLFSVMPSLKTYSHPLLKLELACLSCDEAVKKIVISNVKNKYPEFQTLPSCDLTNISSLKFIWDTGTRAGSIVGTTKRGKEEFKNLNEMSDTNGSVPTVTVYFDLKKLFHKNFKGSVPLEEIRVQEKYKTNIRNPKFILNATTTQNRFDNLEQSLVSQHLMDQNIGIIPISGGVGKGAAKIISTMVDMSSVEIDRYKGYSSEDSKLLGKLLDNALTSQKIQRVHENEASNKKFVYLLGDDIAITKHEGEIDSADKKQIDHVINAGSEQLY